MVVMGNHNHFIVLIHSMGQGFGRGTTGMALLHSTMSGPPLVRRAGGFTSKMVSLLTSQLPELGWLKGWLNWHCWLDYLIRVSLCGLGLLYLVLGSERECSARGLQIARVVYSSLLSLRGSITCLPVNSIDWSDSRYAQIQGKGM